MEHLSNSHPVVRRLREGWGKLRRFLLCYLRPGLVRERIALRTGACRGCGECCDLLFRCPFLDENRRCTTYGHRLRPCGDYPIDERDNRYIDCGYSFPKTAVDGTGWKIPLSPWARGEVLIAALATAAGAASGAAIALVDGYEAGWALSTAFGAFFVFSLFFFRDPKRSPPETGSMLVAPADGKVTDVTEVEEPEFLGGRAVRVGIFMSLFNVHVNRSPCAAEVKFLRHRDGTYADVRKEAAWEANENVLLGLRSCGSPVAVRLVAGAVARRIALAPSVGDCVRRGERIGMVKFGSRAEVLVPVGAGWAPAAKAGDVVRAGESVLMVRSAPGGGA